VMNPLVVTNKHYPINPFSPINPNSDNKKVIQH